VAAALAVIYALAIWWFTTGLVIWLDGLPRRTFRWSIAGASVLALAALAGIWFSAYDPSLTGAFAAFTSAILVWGWHEITFLMGFVTGPRRHACPVPCRGWRHVGHAIETILWHELLIVVSALLIVALTWDAANQVGLWTFMILWLMRLSAKLNVFLGVPNLSEEFLPEHLAYLRRFFTRKPMNLLFPISVTASTLVAAGLVGAAAGATSAFMVAGLSLLATLMVLAVVEHWFLVLPLPSASLWAWWLEQRARFTPSRVVRDTARRGGPTLVRSGTPLRHEAAPSSSTV
jgi:putative photosynthetic complex assembly protein 2